MQPGGAWIRGTEADFTMSNTFYSYYVEYCWRKKPQRVANFPEYFLLSCGLVWLISKYFCLVYTGAPELYPV